MGESGVPEVFERIQGSNDLPLAIRELAILGLGELAMNLESFAAMVTRGIDLGGIFENLILKISKGEQEIGAMRYLTFKGFTDVIIGYSRLYDRSLPGSEKWLFMEMCVATGPARTS
jgi:hypothetical protein